jgi:hypothetical protein
MSRISRQFSSDSVAGASSNVERFTPSRSHGRRMLLGGMSTAISRRVAAAEAGNFFCNPSSAILRRPMCA